MKEVDDLGRKPLDQLVTIVTGLPRSGTSMMMRMLEVGGMTPLIDRIRTADEDNPQGYYEFEPVKQIEEDQSWLREARGHVVKMVSALLRHLPAEYGYKVVFMLRAMPEVLASQHKMLVHRGEPAGKVDDATMAAMFEKHLETVKDWLASQPNVDVLYVNYNEVLADPVEHAERVNRFLGGDLNIEAMVEVVDPDLYRNRQSQTGSR